MQHWQTRGKEEDRQDPATWIKKLLTKKELRHIKCNYFRGGVLGVSVDSSAWLYHLSLKKEDLLLRLRKELPALKEIRFKLGDIE